MNNLNWPTRKLDDVCELQRGSEPGSKTYNEKGEGVRFIRVADVSKHRTNPIWTTGKDLVPCKKDDILMTFDGSLGVVFRGIEGAISSGIRIIKPKNNRELLDDFLFYILQTEPVQNTVKKYTIGVSILHASKSIPHIEIPLPPLKTQKRIAARIKKLFEKINKAKELRKKALEETNQIFQSALYQIFDKAEKKWKKNKLKEVVKEDRKQSQPKKVKKLPYIGMEDIESETGRLLTIPKVKNIKSTTFIFNKNHVLYGKLRPYLNKVFVPNFEGHCTTEFIPFLPNLKILLRDWLAIWLRFPSTVEIIMRTVTGTRMPRANMEDLFNLKIPLPPLPEQKKIVAELDDLRETTEKLKQLQQKQLEELNELKQSILSKAFKK